MRKRIPSSASITIVLVEDNRLVQEGIVAILERHPDLDVVAVVNDAQEALLRVPETGARVVLVDASLGDHDSHGLVENIVCENPEARVIVMDILPGPDDIIEFVRRGAAGFVVKEASVEVFVETIRAVAGGAQVLPPSLTTTIFSHIAKSVVTGSKPDGGRSVRMTNRERQVVELISEGMSNKLIARQLHISSHTVKSHVRNILEKLALHSRLQVAAYARHHESSADEATRTQ